MKYVRKITIYSGADININHNPVVIFLQFRHFIRAQRQNRPKRINIKRLDNATVRVQDKNDLFNFHKKIKEFTNIQCKQCRGILKTEFRVGVEEKLKQWKEYVKAIFNDARHDQSPLGNDVNESSPDIMEEEVRRAIKLQENNKAVGPG